MNKHGEFGGAILSDKYPFQIYAVADADGARIIPLTPLYDLTAELGKDPSATRREIALERNGSAHAPDSERFTRVANDLELGMIERCGGWGRTIRCTVWIRE